jgi:hypothetical protein
MKTREYIEEMSGGIKMDITLESKYEMWILVRFPNGSVYEEKYETSPGINGEVKRMMKRPGGDGKAYNHLKNYGSLDGSPRRVR